MTNNVRARRGLLMLVALCLLATLFACNAGEVPAAVSNEENISDLLKAERNAGYQEGYEAGYEKARAEYQPTPAPEASALPAETPAQPTASTPPAQAEGPLLSVEYVSYEIMQKSNRTYIYCIATLANSGNVSGMLSNAAFDIEDAEGKLLGVVDRPDQSALIIEPGETVYIFGSKSVEFDIKQIGDVKASATLKETKQLKEKYEVTDVAVQPDRLRGIAVIGRFVNNSETVASYLTHAGGVCLDVQGNPLCGMFSFLSGDVAPGERQSFEASERILPESISVDMVESVVPFAFSFKPE